MAEHPDVDLGSVGFGLVANTESLERSLGVLSQFGERVNRVVASANDMTAAYARQQASIERSLTAEFSQIERVSARLSRFGEEGRAALGQLTTQFERLVQTTTKGELFAPQELARGFSGVNAEIARAIQLEKELANAAKAAAAQVDALFRNQQRAANIVTNMQVKGADPALIGQVRSAIAGYERDLRGATLGTEALAERSRALTATLNEIVRASKLQDAAVRATTQAMKEQEGVARQLEAQRRLVSTAQQRTSNIVNTLEIKGANPQLIDQAKAALASYEQALRSTTLSIGGLAAYTRDYAAATNEVVRASKVEEAAIASVARAQKEAEAASKAALAQQKALASAQQASLNLVSSLTTRGAPTQAIDQARAALAQYEASLARGTLSAEQMQAANLALASALGAVRRAFNEDEASTRSATRAQADYLRQARSVESLNVKGARLGIDPSLIQANIAALAQLKAAIAGLGTGGQTAALNALTQSLHATKVAMDAASSSGGRLSTFMYDLNKASILLMGPMSGIGMRVSVLASLFESTSMKTVLFVGGMVGAVSAVATLGTGAVKASMEFEKFNALLNTASGSPALVAGEMKYISEQADKYGQSIRGLIPAYANFSTAARLSGMTLKDQRGVFESVMVTGAALRFDTERTGRTFLALEQMVSKGTVQMQEIKLQLGQAIPGAMEIAAIAMGKTTTEFTKMVTEGKVLTNEFLPKLSKALVDMFGAGALEGAKTLQAEFQRLENATIFFNKALDDQVRASKAVRTIVIALADAIKYLTDNMATLVPILAAVGAAIGALGLIAAGSWILKLVSGVSAAAGVMSQLGGVATRLGAILTLTPGGAVGMFLKLAAVVGSAIFAYNAFGETANKQTLAAQEFSTKTQEWLVSIEKLGWAHKRTYEEMKAQTLAQIELIKAQINATAILAQVTAIGASMESNAGQQKLIGGAPIDAKTSARRGGRSMLLGLLGDRGSPDAEAKKMAEEAGALSKTQKDALTKLQAELESNLARMNKITDLRSLKTGAPADPEKGMGPWNSWIKKIQKDIREVEMQDKQMTDSVSKSAMMRYEAEKQAADLIASMPDKKRGDLGPILKQLEDMGFVAMSATTPIGKLKEALEQMFLTTAQNKEKFKEIAATIQAFESAAKSSGDAMQGLRDKIDAARAVIAGANVEDLANQKALEHFITERTKEWIITIKSTEGIAKAIQEATDLWNESRALDKQAAKMKELKGEVDSMVESWGNKSQKAMAEYQRQLGVIGQAQQLLNMSQSQADDFRQKAADDLFRKQLENSHEVVRQFVKVIKDLENSLAEGLADMFMGTGGGWKEMLQKMEREMLVFMNRMILLKPIMTGLFGDLYTGTVTPGGGNAGIIGNAAKSVFPGIFGNLFGPTPVAQQPGVTGWNSGSDLPTGGGGGGGILSGIGSWIGSLFGGGHMGALIGAATHMHEVSPAVFLNAPRMHNGGGLGYDEVPFIGLRGERVLSRSQTHEYDRGSGGGRHATVNVTYMLQGAMDRKSQDQSAAIVGKRVDRALARNT